MDIFTGGEVHVSARGAIKLSFISWSYGRVERWRGTRALTRQLQTCLLSRQLHHPGLYITCTLLDNLNLLGLFCETRLALSSILGGCPDGLLSPILL